jgi:hypothetical protein
MNKISKKYLLENKKIFELKEKLSPIVVKRQIKNININIFNLLKQYAKDFSVNIIRYLIELFINFKYFKKTFKLKNLYNTKKALIIGNGPSQGFLKTQELDNFVNSGGHTICLNKWHEDKVLSKHIPSWYFLSDPSHFRNSYLKSIIKYFKEHSSIKIVVPAKKLKILENRGLKNELFCFSDSEMLFFKNINPLFPRGYCSMTLYKALAWAVYLGYNSIGAIGMDNTYVKEFLSDENNKLFLLHNNKINESIVLQKYSNLNVSKFLFDLFQSFYHLEYFPNKNIFNLDKYSLTDRFKKISKYKFLNNKN